MKLKVQSYFAAKEFYPAQASLTCHVLCSAQGNREYETRLLIHAFKRALSSYQVLGKFEEHS